MQSHELYVAIVFPFSKRLSIFIEKLLFARIVY